MKIVLPCRGEFGLKICYHVPAVHALAPDLVLAEPGEECLYPSAGKLHFVDPPTDDQRRGLHPRQEVNQKELRRWKAWAKREHPGATLIQTKPGMAREWFVPEPNVPQIDRAPGGELQFDVFLSPRKRRYGEGKNWPYWYHLTDAFREAGFRTFAGGVREASYPVAADDLAWAYPRALDATIEGMLLSRVVVATDAGLAHLAMLVGRPLVLITHAEGLVAPGPVLGPEGETLEPHYWPSKLHRFRDANHRGVPLEVVHHTWGAWRPVFERTLEVLDG